MYGRVIVVRYIHSLHLVCCSRGFDCYLPHVYAVATSIISYGIYHMCCDAMPACIMIVVAWLGVLCVLLYQQSSATISHSGNVHSLYQVDVDDDDDDDHMMESYIVSFGHITNMVWLCHVWYLCV